MCLILFALQQHPNYPVIIAANRDEYYDRASEPAHYWPDHPHLLAGRDSKAGGTWLGITKNGRFAAVTNFREPENSRNHLLSRGELTSRFLLSNKTPPKYLDELTERQHQFAGFNLIIGCGQSFYFFSNRPCTIEKIKPGLHGLSNGALNEDWPKVNQGKQALQKNILEKNVSQNTLMAILANRQCAPDKELPSTGVSLEMERLLSSRFIHSRTYGTRCSTVITVDTAGAVNFYEKSFSDLAQEKEFKHYQFITRPNQASA